MTRSNQSTVHGTDYSTLTIQEAGTTREVILEQKSYTIGRGTDCGIVLSDSNVSRHHAKLNFDGNSWSVTDLQSVNGTFVMVCHLLVVWVLVSTD